MIKFRTGVKIRSGIRIKHSTPAAGFTYKCVAATVWDTSNKQPIVSNQLVYQL